MLAFPADVDPREPFASPARPADALPAPVLMPNAPPGAVATDAWAPPAEAAMPEETPSVATAACAPPADDVTVVTDPYCATEAEALCPVVATRHPWHCGGYPPPDDVVANQEDAGSSTQPLRATKVTTTKAKRMILLAVIFRPGFGRSGTRQRFACLVPIGFMAGSRAA
jgi:hypothetical protein